MGVEHQWDWKAILHDLVLEPRPVGGDGPRWLAHQKFSRHSFLRLHVEEAQEHLNLHLEVALGPTPHDPEDLGRHLLSHLQADEALTWNADLKAIPWELRARVPRGDDASEKSFQQTLRELLKLTDEMDKVDHPSGWYAYLSPPPEAPASAPFESIGVDTRPSTSPEPTGEPTSHDAPEGATIVAGATSRTGRDLLVCLGLGEELTYSSLQRLERGLQDYLRTQYDATAVILDDPEDRPELRSAAAARTRIDLRLTPWQGDDTRELQVKVDRFITRIKEFTSRGVDLFVYLGVGDVVLPSSPPGDRSRHPNEPARSSPAPAGGSTDSDVVFTFGSSSGSASLEETPMRPDNTLVTGDFTDPRLRRDDAEGPLVDLVLRHPGYSDRRISQVLSLLFEIEYVDALRLAERAPCVLARGVGSQRAASFKQVIENAGGKVVLVEPGSFGEV